MDLDQIVRSEGEELDLVIASYLFPEDRPVDILKNNLRDSLKMFAGWVIG